MKRRRLKKIGCRVYNDTQRMSRETTRNLVARRSAIGIAADHQENVVTQGKTVYRHTGQKVPVGICLCIRSPDDGEKFLAHTSVGQYRTDEHGFG